MRDDEYSYNNGNEHANVRFKCKSFIPLNLTYFEMFAFWNEDL